MSATWLARLGAWLRGPEGAPPRFRFVRRVEIQCPHGHGLVSVDMVTDPHGVPETVLRCSAHTECPPSCDQSCRRCADAVRTPATALLVYPPGSGPEDAAD